MKPASFSYARAKTVDDAVALLAKHGDDAKLLAGGQSLIPLLNFRMLRPGILIDINRVAELSFLRDEANALHIGALTRHHTLETSPLVRQTFPVLAEAMAHVAHLAIRNRGTIGGSLSHGDAAAELPMMAVLLNAEIRTRTSTGARAHTARDFFLGPLTTVLEDGEIVTEIVLPHLPRGTGWAFEEVAQRSGDFAIAAVAATVSLREGTVSEFRLAVTGVDETPLRFDAIEALFTGAEPSQALIDEAVALARASVNPTSDLKASADYRRHLVGILTARVIADALRRAKRA